MEFMETRYQRGGGNRDTLKNGGTEVKRPGEASR
jgi:hypothetical protein